MLITEIGFDGFRFDFVKGYGAWMIRSIHERQYVRGGRRLVFPFGVGESWSSDNEIDAWLDEINRYTDNPISAFDFPLRYRLKDLCDTYGFSLRRLAEGGTVMAERPDRAVTFVDNHDFRGGDQAPIINDKLMAYAFILTHPGYPCVFWKDYFEDALGQPGGPRGIAALVGAHERNAGGDAIVRYVDDDLYVMERTGWENATGLVFVLNNRGDGWNGTFVETTRPATTYRPVAWNGRDTRHPRSHRDGTGRPRPVLGPAARLRRLRPRVSARPPHPDPLLRSRRRGRISSGPFSPLAGRRLDEGADAWIRPRHGARAARARGLRAAARHRSRPRGPRAGDAPAARRRVRRLPHRPSTVRGRPRAAQAPVVPGHQIVGRVDGRRRRRRGWRVGDRAGVAWLAGADGTCDKCRSARENLCAHATFTGWDVDGGYATHATRAGRLRAAVPRRLRRPRGGAAAVRRRDRLPLAQAQRHPSRAAASACTASAPRR